MATSKAQLKKEIKKLEARINQFWAAHQDGESTEVIDNLMQPQLDRLRANLRGEIFVSSNSIEEAI